MTKITPGDMLMVNTELLQAFFQSGIAVGAISDDAMNTIFAMTAERLTKDHGATAESGMLTFLNKFVANVKLFADLRDEKARQSQS